MTSKPHVAGDDEDPGLLTIGISQHRNTGAVHQDHAVTYVGTKAVFKCIVAGVV